MIIDGHKYACDACIRGHRVSHCQHQDRELHKVAPKGRPVSQCPHCRGARKVRAQHVACNCAEKGHNEADCPSRKGEKGEPHTCCCTHGARCGCSLKKDHPKNQHHLDPVPEDDLCEIPTPESFDIKPARSAISTPSEGKMTVFANGHHKPVHKHNDAAHTRGLPYTIPRAHSIHGHSELAQRSTDSLPATKTSLVSQDTPRHHDSVTSAPQPVRRVKSQPGSPGLRPKANIAPINTASPALDNTYSPFGTFSGGNSPITSGFFFNPSENNSDSYFGYPSSNADVEGSLPSAGLNGPPPVDWSSLGIQPYNNISSGEYGVAPSQPPSYASFDFSHDYSHVSHPGMTSSSGELSEAEDFPAVSESAGYAGIAMPADTGKFDETNYTHVDKAESYRLSSASSMGFPAPSNAMNMLKQDNVQDIDIDEFLRQANEQTNEEIKRRQHASSISSNLNGMNINHSNSSINSIPTPPTSVPTPPKATPQQTPIHGLTVREAQTYAHQPGNDTNVADSIHNHSGQYSQQLPEDPMWSNPEMNSPEDIKWDS